MRGFRKLGEPLFSRGLTSRLSLGTRMTAGGPSDTTAPVPVITSTETSPTFAATVPLTIVWKNGLTGDNEAVTGFAVGDITVAGCTLGSLSTSDNITFTVTATPTAMAMTVDINAAVCTDAAGNSNQAATQFTMTAMNVGLDLWMRADSIAGNDGDAVGTFTSGEGNALAFTNTGTARPLLKKGANGINNQNTVLFDGSNDILICSTANLWSGRSAGTLFAVVRYTSTLKDYQDVFATADEATAGAYEIEFQAVDNAAHIRMYQDGNGGANDNHGGITAQTTGTAYRLMWRSSGTAVLMTVDEVDQGANGTNNGDWFADTPNRDNATIGGVKHSGLSNYMKGDIAEILLYSTELSAGDTTRVVNYLKARYFP